MGPPQTSSTTDEAMNRFAKPPRVLYVDDEKEFVDLAIRMLGASRTIRVEGATSAPEALRILEKSEYDVVVSDYQMPEMSGIDLLKEMRASGIAMPFVIVTGKGREDVAVEALNSGADLYIQKSADLKVLFTELSTMIIALTERNRRAQRILREVDFYSRIINTSEIGIAAYDPDRIVLIWNSGMERLTGVESRTISGRPLRMDVAQSLSEIIEDRKVEATLSGSSSLLNERSLTDLTSGDEAILDVSYTPVADDSGNVIGGMLLVSDATKRGRAARTLCDSETLLRALFENSREGIVIHELGGRVLNANRTICQYLECAKEQLIGSPFSEFIDRDDRVAFADFLNRSQEYSQSAFETTMISPTGREFPVEINANQIDYRGRPTAVIMIRDAHERAPTGKESEKPLVTPDSFERVVNASPVIVFLMKSDPLWSVTFVSTNVTQFGYTPEEFESGDLSFAKVIHPDDLKALEAEAEARIRAGDPYLELECRIVTKKGEIRWVDSRILIRRDSEGTILDIQGIVLDITDRRKGQEEAEKLAQIVDSSLDAIISKNLDGTVLSWNRAAEELYGYSAEEIIGRPVSTIVPPDRYEEYRTAFRQVKRGKRVPWFETVRVRKDGSRIDVSLTISPVRDRTGKIVGASAIAKDITGHKRIERALRLANEKLELLGSLTRHDVINQVGILTGYLSLLEDESDPSVRSDHVNSAKQACLSIAEQLQFAGNYQEAGTKTPEWARVKLELAGAVSALDMGGVEVIDSTDDLEILVDPMFEKVFVNLLINSRKHGQRVSRITVGHYARGDDMVLAYSDDGVGIPEADKEKIFEPGYGKDSGLGLFLIREILSITGISIAEVGMPGEGATFEMVVPSRGFRFAGQIE